MTAGLVELVHPPTGRVIRLHPDLANQTHHWLHPDPCVPTPPESLPLFDEAALDKLIVRLATQPPQPLQTEPPAVEVQHA